MLGSVTLVGRAHQWQSPLPSSHPPGFQASPFPAPPTIPLGFAPKLLMGWPIPQQQLPPSFLRMHPPTQASCHAQLSATLLGAGLCRRLYGSAFSAVTRSLTLSVASSHRHSPRS